jgi:hypothetical protein
MLTSIRQAFKSKVFTVAFLFCFLLSTPIFYKVLVDDIAADKMDIIHFIALSLQYLFCIVVMPNKLSEGYMKE